MLSVSMFVLAILVILIATQLLWRWIHGRCDNGVLPPGSMGLPLIGETLQLLIPSRSLDIHPFIKSRVLKYGPIFRTSLAGRPVVVSADPQVNHYILSQEGKLVELWYSKVFNQEGESRTSAVGEVHKYIRSTTLNCMGIEALKEKLLPILEETACRTLDSWSNQESVDVKRAFGAMVFNFTAKVFLGYDSEKSPNDLREKYNMIAEGFLSLPLNIRGTTFYKCMKSKETVMKFIKDKFNEKRAAGPRTSKTDLLDQAIDDMATKKFLGEDFIAQMIFGLLFASFESNSSTLTFALFNLAQHPSALEKLTVEQESVIKNRENVKSSVTWDEYKSMTFTLHVINETLRLASFAPGLLRRALKDIHVNGYTIPAGWTILIASSAQQLNPDVFDGALEFNPSRWKDIDKAAVQQNFMPFGGGMRQCAGAEFSKALLSIFLHVLVTKYRWSVIKTGNVRRSPILSYDIDGVHVKISKKD